MGHVQSLGVGAGVTGAGVEALTTHVVHKLTAGRQMKKLEKNQQAPPSVTERRCPGRSN